MVEHAYSSFQGVNPCWWMWGLPLCWPGTFSWSQHSRVHWNMAECSISRSTIVQPVKRSHHTTHYPEQKQFTFRTKLALGEVLWGWSLAGSEQGGNFTE